MACRDVSKWARPSFLPPPLVHNLKERGKVGKKERKSRVVGGSCTLPTNRTTWWWECQRVFCCRCQTRNSVTLHGCRPLPKTSRVFHSLCTPSSLVLLSSLPAIVSAKNLSLFNLRDLSRADDDSSLRSVSSSVV